MNEPFFHVFDVETSTFDKAASSEFTGPRTTWLQDFLRVSTSANPADLTSHPLFQGHRQSGLLQLFTTDLLPAGDAGWVTPQNIHRWHLPKPEGYPGLLEGGWQASRGLIEQARADRQALTEAARLEQFFHGLERSIAQRGRVGLVGHNSFGFDLWEVEQATRRSLPERAGWLARTHLDQKLVLRDTHQEILQAALDLAKVDAEFAKIYLGNASTVEDVAKLGGTNLEHILQALRVEGGAAHNAMFDSQGAQALARALDRGLTPQELRRIFRPGSARARAMVEKAAPATANVARAVEQVAEATAEVFTKADKRFLAGVGIGVAATVVLTAQWLAHSKRKDRQTQISALPEEGLAAAIRHKMTAFGSGWQGLDKQLDVNLESEQAYSWSLRALGLGVTGTALGVAHGRMLRDEIYGQRYARKLYDWAKIFEEKSPAHIGRTFGFSERLEQHTIVGPIIYGADELTTRGTSLSRTGKTLQRMIGRERLDILKEIQAGRALTFEKREGDLLHTLIGEHADVKFKARFSKAGGRLAGSASRLDAELDSPSIKRSTDSRWWKRLVDDFYASRAQQQIHNGLPKREGLQRLEFEPIYGYRGALDDDPIEHAKATVSNLWARLRFEMLEAVERPQRLFSEIGLGLKTGSWNSASGLVRGMLTRRVLPIVAGATALKYADYKLHHAPSNLVINTALKVNVLRADLTDMLPGGRAVTDFYDDVVPGPQYGPLALPMAGMFVGGGLHYTKVLANKFALTEEGEKLRKASSRVFPQILEDVKGLEGRRANLRAVGKHLTSTQGLRKLWGAMGLPGKGLVIGAAAMLPFVPGMLGSRKTGAELRDIYSGQEPVPIRAGRWWELGCQAPTNLHLTPNGLRTAQEVYAQRLTILNGQGSFETPVEYLRYEYHGPLYRIRVSGQVQAFSFTPNHEILVYRDAALGMVRADALQPGDAVALRKLEGNPATPTLDLSFVLEPSPSGEQLHRLADQDRFVCVQTNWFTKRPQKAGSADVPMSVVLDREFGFLVGHYLAEGNLNSSQARGLRGVEHCCHTDEAPVLSRLSDTYERVFGYRAELKCSKEKKHGKDVELYRYRVTSKPIAVLFDHLFHQQGHRHKTLPLWLVQAGGDEFRKGVLEGWFYGDGCYLRNKKGQVEGIRIVNKFLENTYVLRKLFSQFNAAASIYRHDQTNNGQHYSGHSISVTGLDCRTLVRAHGLRLSKYAETLSAEDIYTGGFARTTCVLPNYVCFTITNIDVVPAVDGCVYDFTVNSDHEYETAEYVTHNSTAYEGGRIKAWRPHKSLLLKSRAETKAVYGSEQEYWRHNPLLHPVRWLRDPYWLEKQHYKDRPYPVASPAFSNVPLIGPLLAATIGKVVKPSVRMHEEDWSGEDYSLYSTRLEPKGPGAVAPPTPKDEFGLGRALKQEAAMFAEYTGLYGFVAQSFYNAAFPDYDKGREAFFQGSRQMSNFSRRYYEQEFGAGIGLAASGKEHFGYTEPFRRFVQREDFTPQANEIPNTMPSWLPGDDYFVNFKVGDPYVKVDEGYARLPGAGYEALHTELEGVSPEDYPDINKLAILADVAPYSREYNTFRQVVGKQAEGNTELKIEYERILDRVQKTKASIVRMDRRRFTAPVDTLEGTVATAAPSGFTLKEFPGRTFHYSSIGMSAADMTARILGEHNDMTRADAAREVDRRQGELSGFLAEKLVGQSVSLTVPEGAAETLEHIQAVVDIDGDNFNRELIDKGYASYREDRGGAEAQAMHSVIGRTVGKLAEGLAFEGDESALNPRRYVPSPGHTKFWQERTPLAQYVAQEVAGTRMRRWHRPIHDFLAPYLRGAAYRLLGTTVIPSQVEFNRDLNTLTDMLQYMRSLVDPAYTSQGKRTSIGANLFASPTFVASTLPDREVHYFRAFLNESDSEKRAEILQAASPEMARALEAQWTAQRARLEQAEGKRAEPVGEGGRLLEADAVAAYKADDTELGYGDWLRSKEIADFFSRTGFTMPEDAESPVFDPALDYDDVKLKIVQQEGYDAHDFNLFDDRSALLWRKPYVDGAVRELTSGRARDPEQLRRTVEQLMLAAKNRHADIRTTTQPALRSGANVRLDVVLDDEKARHTDMRRNPEKYEDVA